MDQETSGHGSNKKKRKMNRERLGSIHSLCYKILLNLARSCQSQMAQTIYDNMKLGVIHRLYDSPNIE